MVFELNTKDRNHNFRELTIEELEMVYGGGAAINYITDVFSRAYDYAHDFFKRILDMGRDPYTIKKLDMGRDPYTIKKLKTLRLANY